jgi:hypothetical protein
MNFWKNYALLLIFFLILCGLQIADVFSTIIFLGRGIPEGNPIGVWFLDQFGTNGLFYAKMFFIVPYFLLICFIGYKKKLPKKGLKQIFLVNIFLIFLYSVVIINNMIS